MAQGTSKLLLSIQAFVTIIFAPLAMFWLFGVISDILITTKHPLFGIEVSIQVMCRSMSHDLTPTRFYAHVRSSM